MLFILFYIDVALTDELKTAIQDARTTFLTSTSKLGVDYMQYTKFGKDFIKTKKLSPDSFMQLAFQVRLLTLQTVRRNFLSGLDVRREESFDHL